MMKFERLPVLGLACLLLAVLAAHPGRAGAEPAGGGAAAGPAGPAYVLQVDGLACPFCAYGIEKSLSRIPGVVSVKTDIKSGVVVVTMRQGASLSEAAANQAVQDAGFTLRGFKAKPPAS